MDFVSVRIITDNLEEMVAFYEKMTGTTADRPAPVFAELHFPSCTLAPRPHFHGDPVQQCRAPRP
jgi:hypothetical protein